MECSAMTMLRAKEKEAGNKLSRVYGRAAMDTCRVLQALSSCTIPLQKRPGRRCAVPGDG